MYTMLLNGYLNLDVANTIAVFASRAHDHVQGHDLDGLKELRKEFSTYLRELSVVRFPASVPAQRVLEVRTRLSGHLRHVLWVLDVAQRSLTIAEDVEQLPPEGLYVLRRRVLERLVSLERLRLPGTVAEATAQRNWLRLHLTYVRDVIDWKLQAPHTLAKEEFGPEDRFESEEDREFSYAEWLALNHKDRAGASVRVVPARRQA